MHELKEAHDAEMGFMQLWLDDMMPQVDANPTSYSIFGDDYSMDSDDNLMWQFEIFMVERYRS